jgi:hypothetical protein|tara:strand:+ start:136 stop:285 length:150 start_codon:yes stop_codon:yes gene_type:complete
MKNSKIDREYYLYLANLRNDFYNKGNLDKAQDVQEEIDTMGSEKNNFRI